MVTCAGCAEEKYALERGVKAEQIVYFDTPPSGIKMLQQGRVDVFALSGLGTQDLLNKTNDPNLELVMPITGVPIGCAGAAFNMDNKELIAGTTLYLPIFVDGANFSAGDGHGCQGDGEVCVTAIETALEGTFRLTVRDDMSITLPYAENETHIITMAFDEDLDDAAKEALRQMIGLITQRTNLSKAQAYSLCSLTADLRVTQIVNGNKGIHAIIPKSVI